MPPKTYKKSPYRKKRTTPAKKTIVRKAFQKAASYKIKKVVNQVLARKVETKVNQYFGSLTVRSITAATTQAQFDSGCLMITPQGAVLPGITQGYPVIANGVGQDQRIGDECKIKGQYLNFVLSANDYDATFNPTPSPQLVTVWVVRPKIRNGLGLTLSDIQSGSSAIFFENQFNADSGLTGTFIDMLRKVDTDNYTVVSHRTYKVGWQGNLSTTNVVSSFQSNDYKQFYKGRIKIPAYTWKCDRLELHQGRNTYIFLTTMNGNGITGSTTFLPCSFDFNLTTYYTDM